MELTEVVSPSVAVPVICVLVCAFLVFAFGFKSPAQPPSFDVFDEDGKKKRTKKSKGSKGQSNGHAVLAGEADVNNSAKPQSSPRQVQKQQSSKSQTTVSKNKVAAQPVQEAPKKVKKSAAKEEEIKAVKKQEIEEDLNGDDGWHTVPKKDKKQKKKESERQDSPVKEEEIVVKSEEPVDASLVVTKEVPGSPQEQRNKKKKEKKNKKSKTDEEAAEQIKVEPEVEVAAASSVVVEPEPEVVDASIELQIKDAMETTVSLDNGAVDKKRKSKKDKKKAMAIEEDDFVIPQAAIETEVVEQEPETLTDLPLKENTDALTVKVLKKKQKKDRSKRNEEKLPDSMDIGASGEVDSSLSQSSVSDIQPKKTKVKDTSVKEEPPLETSPGAEGGASSDVSNPPQITATFDELGGTTESWTEAKPKSKKKKARRAD